MGRKIGAVGLTQHNEKFYGNYRGTVMDNIDSDKLGRIKVKIYPMLSGVETENLPWAVPAMPLSSGAGEDYGTFCVPEIGTNVWVFFEAGDIYQPVFFAEATDGMKGLPVDIDEDYPNTTVMETKTGIVIKINRKEGNENVLVEHPTGSFIEMDKEGNVFITSAIDKNVSLLTSEGAIYLEAAMVNTSKGLAVGDGADGTFTSADSKIITVAAGIVTSIV